MSFKTQCDLRRNLIQLEAQAERAAGMIGRCTTAANNAYWQERADELYRLADQQYNALITEIERDIQTQTQTKHPAESHQTAPTRPLPAIVAKHAEYDDLGNVEAF